MYSSELLLSHPRIIKHLSYLIHSCIYNIKFITNTTLSSTSLSPYSIVPSHLSLSIWYNNMHSCLLPLSLWPLPTDSLLLWKRKDSFVFSQSSYAYEKETQPQSFWTISVHLRWEFWILHQTSTFSVSLSN